MDFEIWLYRGLIAILLVFVWYVLRKFTSGILGKIDIIIQKLSELSGANTLNEERIKELVKTDDQISKRLEDHAIRLRKVEQKQSACRVCKTETA